MEKITTDLPFKAGGAAIVILKDLPVFQCSCCAEYVLEDPVMRYVELILEKTDPDMELKIVKYAA